MRACDIDPLHRPPERGGPDHHGWCFGLLPGITAHRWPLDPNNGCPLTHGFTLLPGDYRCHGPEVVALSFFAPAFDHNDGGPEVTEGMRDAVAAPGAEAPEDPTVRPFWEASRRPHPRLHRMRDILDCDYAVVLLTRAEFERPLCPPPSLVDSPLLAEVPEPRWLRIGSAAAFFELEGGLFYIGRELGGAPEEGLLYDRALLWRPRAQDPNAGKAPRSPWGQQGDYNQPFEWIPVEGEKDRHAEKPWIEGHARNHVGGTTQPCQETPLFSPYYIGLEEWFGSHNFGSGNAQLDFKDIRLDWACG